MKSPTLYIVVPCYNEQDVLDHMIPVFVNTLLRLYEKGMVSEESRVLFVDDGSNDRTWRIIKDASENLAYMDKVIGIHESRNNGHQNALMAGMMEARAHCDIVITIDCDGQDDIYAIDDMVESYLSGFYDIVYGVRSSRKKDSCFKRSSAQCYYKLLQWFGAEIVYNHADYRLVSRRVLDELQDYQEVNLFLRGLFPMLGFRSTTVYYERNERLAGKSKYPLRKMLSFGMNGVTNLSTKPLTLIMIFGFIVALISFVGCIWAVIGRFCGNTVPGWASMTSIVCFVCGVQLICTGVLGTYIGKIYLEVKHRPRYIISDRTDNLK